MATGLSDALVVVEEWVGEHYFTTDAKSESFTKRVTDKRKEWDGVDKEGGEPSVRGRFLSARVGLEKQFATLFAPSVEVLETDTEDEPEVQEVRDADVLGPLYAQLREVLGFNAAQLKHEVRGPVTFTLGDAGVPVFAWVNAVATAAVEDVLAKDGSTLLEPYVTDDEDEITSAVRLLSHVFQVESPPAFAVVASGGRLVVAEAERWPEGRYLVVELQVVAERNDGKKAGEVDRALCCVAAECLVPDASGVTWWAQTLEESQRHAVGVSADLRHGVRESIDIIGNDVVTRRAAQGLDALPGEQANVLARQALRYLYRVLFVLYAESSPQLGVLPVGAPEYEQGYSVDRLRDVTLVELTSESARQGTHLYESLAKLFSLINVGHLEELVDAPQGDAGVVEDELNVSGGALPVGLVFRSLRADLFEPQATSLIDEVGLSNGALQQVLQRLLLSKEQKGRDRGFISYTELGINQLGAVYEGLMSYSGHFAREAMYEVAPNGDPVKGSWLVPVRQAEGYDDGWFVRRKDQATGEFVPVRHDEGRFVFRLSGRERQQSASYYTPEVLTSFTVGQALEELFGEHPPILQEALKENPSLREERNWTAADVLDMTVCEPALGSGAFALEAVRQLAQRYLKMAQAERGEQIDPDVYPLELQKVKAYIALHNVYGVDLNATAVELAEISLWLDTMVPGLRAPWFGLRLRRGNSLIGGRRGTYTQQQVADKEYLEAPPKRIPLGETAHYNVTDKDSHIWQFVLPSAGWGAGCEAKEVKSLVPDGVKALKENRREYKKKLSKAQVKRLARVSERVEVLWQFALRRLQIAEHQSRRQIGVWGLEDDGQVGAVTRGQIEEALADPTGAYQRVRRIVDAWCAMWFWPVHGTDVSPPSIEEWVSALERLVGVAVGKKTSRGNQSHDQGLEATLDWGQLSGAESLDIAAHNADAPDQVKQDHPWLQVCESIAQTQGFFHWEFDFSTVFARGGFTLQVGNPPWVRPRSDVDALLAEHDPWWKLALKPTEKERKARRATLDDDAGVLVTVVEGTTDVACVAEFVGDMTTYPHLAGLQPDLYRCFMSQVWGHADEEGISCLVHPESHFTDEKARTLRRSAYHRLRRHWQFFNALFLYEVHDQVSYGVHTYGRRSVPSFIQATSLYHPDTIKGSLRHDGSGTSPGFKNADGHWDISSHKDRILHVSRETLVSWRDVLESQDADPLASRMLYTVNSSVAEVLSKLASSPRVAELGLNFSRGWDESIDRKKGFFTKHWGEASWNDAILQGPHLHVNTPFFKFPNSTMKHNQDWSEVDLEQLPADALPVTAYKPAGDRKTYDESYTHWGVDSSIPARDHYRIAWRAMAANRNERTLIPAIIPPGTGHINGVFTKGSDSLEASKLVGLQGVSSSLLSDFLVRAAPKSGIYESVFDRLPSLDPHHELFPRLTLRTLQLNCLTEAYADLWEACWDDRFQEDEWSPIHRPGARPLGSVQPEWTGTVPLRVALDRRNAQVEIDVLVAMMLGISMEELCTVYRTQFAVLYGYDRNKYVFDQNGRVVPNEVLKVWRKKGGEPMTPDQSPPMIDGLSEGDLTATNQAGYTYKYKQPFFIRDREQDFLTTATDFASFRP